MAYLYCPGDLGQPRPKPERKTNRKSKNRSANGPSFIAKLRIRGRKSGYRLPDLAYYAGLMAPPGLGAKKIQILEKTFESLMVDRKFIETQKKLNLVGKPMGSVKFYKLASDILDQSLKLKEYFSARK